ncbi:MAG: carbon-nitrogen hydrolase family protein [Pseudomonadota bacterium]
MRTALLQLNSSDDPQENLPAVRDACRQAVAEGAGFVLTPEVTNCVSASRSRQNDVLSYEREDPFLAGLRDEAARAGAWVLIGSLGLKTDDADGRFANRSFLLDPSGEIQARYDKIHMFDVAVTETETYRESAGYRPGGRAVVAETPFAKIGLSVCYDVRFSALYRALAQGGAEVLTVPAAFSPVTGAAHWEPLLRARAIENGCYVLAPAQCGTHAAARGRARQTHGHSIGIDPWGQVLGDAGTAPGMVMLDLDMKQVHSARARVPALTHDRPFSGP